jgi:hypothetical protein
MEYLINKTGGNAVFPAFCIFRSVNKCTPASHPGPLRLPCLPRKKIIYKSMRCDFSGGYPGYKSPKKQASTDRDSNYRAIIVAESLFCRQDGNGRVV